MPQLQTLALLHSNAGDILYYELSKSKSLLRLRSGTCLINAEYCGITEKGAQQIAKIEQLEELVLGKPSDYSEEPAAKTEAAYKAILKNMRSLKALEMREANLQRLNLGKQ